MDLVIFILSIAYLCGVNCGTGLAICAIIEVVLLTVQKVLEREGL